MCRGLAVIAEKINEEWKVYALAKETSHDKLLSGLDDELRYGRRPHVKFEVLYPDQIRDDIQQDLAQRAGKYYPDGWVIKRGYKYRAPREAFAAVARSIYAIEDLESWFTPQMYQGADLRDANLQGANLRDANLQGADLRGADLWGADLRGADLQGADLRDANLRGADLQDADLQGADLRGADLWDAYLRGADLQGADLRDANLRDANLQGADLRDANLRGANLWGADLQGADKDEAIGL